MLRISKRFLGIAAGLFFLAGCGQGDSGGTGSGGSKGGASLATVETPSELGRLVPADAIALLYAPSLSSLEQKINEVARLFDPSAEEAKLGELLAQMLHPDVLSHLDSKRPLAVAVALSVPSAEGGRRGGGGPDSEGSSRRGGPEPVITVIVPVDAKTELPKVEPGHGPTMQKVGGYVGSSMSQTYAASASASALVAKMPAGDVALRLDIAKAYAQMRPQIEEMLAGFQKKASSAGESDPQAAAGTTMLKSMSDGLKKFLESAERLDLAAQFKNGRMDLDIALTTKDGNNLVSSLISGDDPTPLASILPKDYPLEMVLSVKMDEVQKLLLPLMKTALEQMPPEVRANYDKLMEAQSKAYGTLGGAVAFGMSMGPDGMECVGAMQLKDAAGYRKAMDDMYAMVSGMPDMPMKMTPLPAAKVAGVDVRGWTMVMDASKLTPKAGTSPEAQAKATEMMDKMFGKNGMRFREAVVGSKVVMTMGGDDAMLAKAIEAAKSGGSVPAGMKDALSRVSGKTAVAVRLELRELIGKLMGMVKSGMGDEGAKVPTVPAGPPIVCTVNGSVDGRVLRGALSVDLAGIASAVKAMKDEKNK